MATRKFLFGVVSITKGQEELESHMAEQRKFLHRRLAIEKSARDETNEYRRNISVKYSLVCNELEQLEKAYEEAKKPIQALNKKKRGNAELPADLEAKKIQIGERLSEKRDEMWSLRKVVDSEIKNKFEKVKQDANLIAMEAVRKSMELAVEIANKSLKESDAKEAEKIRENFDYRVGRVRKDLLIGMALDRGVRNGMAIRHSQEKQSYKDSGLHDFDREIANRKCNTLHDEFKTPNIRHKSYLEVNDSILVRILKGDRSFHGLTIDNESKMTETRRCFAWELPFKERKPFEGQVERSNPVRFRDRNYEMALAFGKDRKFVHFVFKMHRRIPAGAEVTEIELRRSRVGSRHVWSVEFTINIPTDDHSTLSEWRDVVSAWKESNSSLKDYADERGIEPDVLDGWVKKLSKRKRGTLFIHPGARIVETADGKALRVAIWYSNRDLPSKEALIDGKVTDIPDTFCVGDSRNTRLVGKKNETQVLNVQSINDLCGRGEILIESASLNYAEHVFEMQSERDDQMNTMQKVLVASLKELNTVRPLWFAERTKTITMWKGWSRFVGLHAHWKFNRFKGDIEVFTILDEWRRKDIRIQDREAFQRRRFQKRRNNAFRVFCRWAEYTHQRVVVSKIPVAKVMKGKGDQLVKTEQQKELQSVQKRRMSLAAPSALCEIAKETFGDDGYIECKTDFISQRCSRCGHQSKRNGDLFSECPECHLKTDQDWNAIVNMAANDLQTIQDNRREKKFTPIEEARIQACKGRYKKNEMRKQIFREREDESNREANE